MWTALVFLQTATAWAEDIVVVQLPTQSVLVTYRGMVTDYTGDVLSLRTGPAADVRTFPFTDVVSVKTDYVEAHVRGRDLFAAGKIREAEEQFQLALEDEERAWVRRELLASLVRCALYVDDLHRAAIRFVALIESDPHSMHWGLIPLVWDVDAVPLPTEVQARTMQAIGSPLATLIAASWNLERNGRRHPDAEAALQALAADADPIVQRLAQMQLWRVRLATNAVTPNELRRWESAATHLPPGLRLGAHVLMGQAAMQQQGALKAAAEWLWVPLLHADHRGLAAWCQLQAAEAMSAAGDATAAEALAREGQQRFPLPKFQSRTEALLKTTSGERSSR